MGMKAHLRTDKKDGTPACGKRPGRLGPVYSTRNTSEVTCAKCLASQEYATATK